MSKTARSSSEYDGNGTHSPSISATRTPATGPLNGRPASSTLHAAPLIAMTKAEIIRLGMRLGVDHGQTLSCYDPDSTGRACGRCDACVLRLKGFAELGMSDPRPYV